MSVGRRDFMKSLALGAGAAAAGASSLAAKGTSPVFAGRLATSVPNDRKLVVLIMRGGFDGLSWLVPYGEPNYQSARPNIGYSSSEVLSINSIPNWGWNAHLAEFNRLYNAGVLAFAHQVGYPQENLSHFVSQDVWAAARRDPSLHDSGWMGRLAEAQGYDAENVIGVGTPNLLEYRTNNYQGLALSSVDDFQVPAEGATVAKGNADAIVGDTNLDPFLRLVAGANQGAHDLSGRVQSAVQHYVPDTIAPDYAAGSSFHSSLKDLARVMAGSEHPSNPLRSNFFVTQFGGWDSHNSQRSSLDTLLPHVNQGVAAFVQDLVVNGLWSKTAVLVVTEFGRRNYENTNPNPGTDHGHGNVSFAFGGGVNGGAYGQLPNAAALAATAGPNNEGYLPMVTDLRQILFEAARDHLQVPTATAVSEFSESGSYVYAPETQNGQADYLGMFI